MTDSTANKIFVGGLSWESTIKDIREYFENFGPVVDCTLKTDPNTGKSRGFGFVTFEEPSIVDKVLEEKKHILNGKKIDPKRAQARMGNPTARKIFVGGIDPNMPEEEIKKYFTQFGQVEDIDLPFDKVKNQRRAFCFITFQDESAVDLVCSTQKQDINGRQVDVKRATQKKDQQQNAAYNPWGTDQTGYDYSAYYNQGYGNYDYSAYGQGANAQGGYDYSSYYQQQGQNAGWGGYDQSGYGGQQGQQSQPPAQQQQGQTGAYGQQQGYDYNSGGYQGYENSQGGGTAQEYGTYPQGTDNSYGGQESQDYGPGKMRGGASRGGGTAGGQGYHPYNRQ